MSFFYSIIHHTHHEYSETVSESHMEVRTLPRSDGGQRCLSFELVSDPKSNVLQYQDYLGNTVHHFDVPGKHAYLHLTARALVEVIDDFPTLPKYGPEAWAEIDRLVTEGDNWEMVMPSKFVPITPRLLALAEELGAKREGDPGELVTRLNAALFKWLAYSPQTTKVDSTIDEALELRKGVCQDFSHIMLGLLRHLGIPARYVSGYFFWQPGQPSHDHGATHAWVEALLPEVGWVGLDPSNNLPARGRHIRVAYGRDYADVPPTRGVFKGSAESDISVKVHVKELQERPKHAFAALIES